MTTRSQGDLLVHWRQGPHKLEAGSFAAPAAGFNGGDQIQTTTTATLRSTPSATGTTVASMPSGRQLYVTGKPLIIDTITFVPVIYTDAATSGWVSAAQCSLVTAAAAPQYVAPAPLVGIRKWEEGICTTAANFRHTPSITTGVIIRVIPVGAVVTMTGNNVGTFREVDYGLERGWVLATSFNFTSSSMPAFPAFTHRFTWALDTNESTWSNLAVQYAIQDVLHDRKSWQRTGVRIDQLSDPAAAMTRVRIVNTIVVNGVTLTAGNGHCESHDPPAQDILRLKVSFLGSYGWVNGVNHEFGHSMFKAWDTYDNNPAGLNAANYFSIMGEARDYRGNIHQWPDADDVASIKDHWLAGNAPNFINRPPE